MVVLSGVLWLAGLGVVVATIEKQGRVVLRTR